MSISFRAGDYRMAQLIDASLKTEFAAVNAHFYGLADQPRRSDISVFCMEEIEDGLKEAVQMFRRAGLNSTFKEFVEVDREAEFEGLRIGINRRLREDLPVAKRIVRTLLLAAQDKLKLDLSLNIQRKPSKARPAPKKKAEEEDD